MKEPGTARTPAATGGSCRDRHAGRLRLRQALATAVGASLVLTPLGGGFAMARTAYRCARAVAAPGPAGLEDLLVTLAAAAATLLLVRLTGAAAAGAWDVAAQTRRAGRWDEIPGGRSGHRAADGTRARRGGARSAVVPRSPARRVVAAVLGAVLGAALAGPAVAASASTRGTLAAAAVAGGPSGEAASSSFDAVVDPGWSSEPDTPAPAHQSRGAGTGGGQRAGGQPDGRPRPAGTSLVGERVVVRSGDSLWDIAARDLGPPAADGEIARRWPTWYEVNREVIGVDPGLIRPGQVLRRPASTAGAAVGGAER